MLLSIESHKFVAFRARLVLNKSVIFERPGKFVSFKTAIREPSLRIGRFLLFLVKTELPLRAGEVRGVLRRQPCLVRADSLVIGEIVARLGS